MAEDLVLYERHAFDSTDARNAWLDENAADRKAGDAPGSYTLPNGGALTVFLTTVSVYLPRDDALTKMGVKP